MEEKVEGKRRFEKLPKSLAELHLWNSFFSFLTNVVL